MVFRAKKRKYFLPVVLLVLFVACFFLINIWFLQAENKDKSFSFTQKWKQYYSIEDWDLGRHAIIDIDGDGRNDMITITGCAFLTSVNIETIPTEKRCEEPYMSPLVFYDNSVTIGQKLVSVNPLGNTWPRKSFLVKTPENTWRFYDMEGLSVRAFNLNSSAHFQEVKPTFLDGFDAFTYQITHLGMLFFLLLIQFLG